jgi:signal transduction histidine kinase
VVRDLVERHGGRIFVADGPEGRGARFIALVPRGIEAARLAEVTASRVVAVPDA